MDPERISSYLGDADLPNGLEQKNVIIQRDRFGYGLTVSGDNPVYILSVRDGGAAHRAGINVNDQIIKVNGTRVTHCTHIDVVNLIKSGSYAQLTLLGQPKGNSTSTQKIIPAESQNDRVQIRSHGHPSLLPQRSGSTGSNHSVQVNVDTKKDRDNYERISKQLEKSRAELDRQRAKGPNQNPTKIATIESQIHHYEQKLKDIKQRLSVIEPPFDFGTMRTKDEDSNIRSSVNESSFTNRTSMRSDHPSGHKKEHSSSDASIFQTITGVLPTAPTYSVGSPIQHLKRKFYQGKSETYDLSKWYINDQYADSSNTVLPNDDESTVPETNEHDETASEIPSKTSVTSFDDIHQLVTNSNWSPLTVFLHFLLTDSNHEANCLLFYIFAEELRLRKAENRGEFYRWVFEIHSTFTMNGSPLYIGLPQPQTDSINGCLEAQQQDTTDEIKTIFNDAKEFARSFITDRQLTDFNQKRSLGAYRDIDFSLIPKQHHFIEETLRSKFESFYKANIDDWNSTKNAKELALLCSLATYLKRCDIKKCGNIPLEKIPKFFDREQRRLLVKLPRAPPTKKIKEHQLIENQFSTTTFCQVCSKPLWGIQYQGYLCGYCQQAFHRECATNSERCLKDRKNTIGPAAGKQRKPAKNPSRSFSADNLIPPLFGMPFSCVQQNIEQQVISPQRVLLRRSVGGSSTLFSGFLTTLNGPTRSANVQDDGSNQNESHENTSISHDNNDPSNSNALSPHDQNKIASLGRCVSDRRVTPIRVPPKNRSSSNPQMGGNTIDELLGQTDNEQLNPSADSTGQKNSSMDLTASPDSSSTDGDSDLEADVNSLPNLSDFIPSDVLQALYQSREWKLQTTINELIHTERTHLKGLKIMKKCFREPMTRSPNMSPVELDCIFRNLDELIELHSQFKYALRQHREEAKDHVVRHIGDLILKFLDGENGEKFARACAHFIEDQSQALKLIKKKEQSPEFAQLMRTCEANPLCRRLTLKDYLPSVMTRFTKLKMLFEAMKKFVADDEIENEKLCQCIDRADYILKRMNYARLIKEQEALLKQIQNNLDIQIPADDKSMDLKNLEICLDVNNNRLIYSGTLKLLPDLNTQKTEFECCLFTDTFVFFQKIPQQLSEQRGIEETYRYVLKEHQRDAKNGRNSRTRPPGGAPSIHMAQNFILTPIIRLEHLLIKKKACGGARSFYVINTDKKQLIEVEANSKDELEKWLEWIEKARKPFEKTKSSVSTSSEKGLTPSNSITSTSSRSISVEEPPTNSLVESTPVKINEKQTSNEDNPDLLYNAILEKDKELNRLLHEKEILLSRLLNIPQSNVKDTPGSVASTPTTKANSSLEALTYAASCHNQLMQTISQTQNRAAKEKKGISIELQSLWTPLTQLGEQLSLALKLADQRKQETPLLNEYQLTNPSLDNALLRRNSSSCSSALTITPSLVSSTSQNYSDLKDFLSMSSLHSSESLGSVAVPLQTSTLNESTQFDRRSPNTGEHLSSITDLDETIKSPISHSKTTTNVGPSPSIQPRQLHMAREVIERYDEGVFDDGTTSQNEDEETNSVVIAESDDEDEIEHFDSTDSITVSIDHPTQRSNNYLSPINPIQTSLDNSNNLSIGGQSANLDLDEDEVYDNVKSNDSSRTNNSDNNGSRFSSEA